MAVTIASLAAAPAPKAQVTAAPGSQLTAQPAAPERPASSPIDPAERALVEGRFADVERLANEPDAPASRRIVLARADAMRGKLEAARERLAAEVATAPAGDAALELAFVLRDLGRRDEATKLWNAIVEDRTDRSAATLYRQGRAYAALDQPRRASAAFQAAAADAPGDPRIATAWAELFLDKQNAKEAAETFETALQADPKWVPALVGYAAALADDDPAAARASLDKALAIDDASMPARLWLAEQAMDGRRLADANAEIVRVLAVNPEQVDALSLQAAIAAIEDRTADADQLAQRVLALRPGSGRVYRVIGQQLAGHYRFEEAVAQLRKAAAIDPEDPRTQAALGMHLLRVGDEAAARTALDAAFKRDPFDVVTYNSLSMLDTLDNFQTISLDGLTLKLHPEEAPLMRDPVEQLARKALADLGKRYGVEVKGPVLIEMFPKHDDFAVRTLGLPGMVGALGACFGRVVTLDSPRARLPPGSFNWSATLWHELAHVVTLQLSNQRVPRWLTEGASVFEERRADPSWGREGELDFLRAYAAGKAIPLASLNSAFTDGRTIGLAYHQSSLLVEHLVERFGDGGLQKLLAAYGRGENQEAAFQSAFGVDLASLQTSFDGFLEARFKGPRAALAPIEDTPPEIDPSDPKAVATLTAFADAHPGQYDLQVTIGRLLIARGAKDQARRILERAAPLVPQTMGDESARALLAGLAEDRGDTSAALEGFADVLKESHTAIESARKLMTLGRQANQPSLARAGAERVLTLDPFDATAHGEVGRAALAAGDIPAAIKALEQSLALKAVDPVTQHTDLAEAYLRAGKPEETRKHAILALELAPRFERAQELLLQVVDGR